MQDTESEKADKISGYIVDVLFECVALSGMTQNEIAKKAGIDVPRFSQLKKVSGTFYLRYLLSICSVINVDASNIVGEGTDRYNQNINKIYGFPQQLHVRRRSTK